MTKIFEENGLFITLLMWFTGNVNFPIPLLQDFLPRLQKRTSRESDSKLYFYWGSTDKAS